ncbi:hypothetical protein SAMN05192549_10968 [Duganella sacchari]|uniref:Methyltransferase domain-containing protein n=1 Tax=Duganella sacchari TaxID=551987 RepID=A0A1M7R119_9BURK|nr:hypothetical protein [Duganella sacchari]SHN38167.1 hypothetical protein SAMN05192549_10968 [Duganella sacchari]
MNISLSPRAALRRIISRVTESVVQERVKELLLAERGKPSASIFLPPIDVYQSDPQQPFMPYSTCSAADFYHPSFTAIARSMAIPPMLHRKFWEWAYIVHAAQSRGVVAPGKRALGFGVGTERMPALFAKGGMHVTATDAPQSVDQAQGWSSNGQYSSAIDSIPYGGILDRETFHERVHFEECDMNAIGEQFRDYDFCWSSCALEHLGSLQLGLDFVINSVEKTLKVGGIACHTTEFNLSSNDATVEDGPTVLYRRKDWEALITELRARGHHVDAFAIAPDAHFLDGYVDTVPFASTTPQNGPAHLKLELFGYACTSVGIIVQRGR